jgi:hypothetical protein
MFIFSLNLHFAKVVFFKDSGFLTKLMDDYYFLHPKEMVIMVHASVTSLRTAFEWMKPL